jgi:hypothetical protein
MWTLTRDEVRDARSFLDSVGRLSGALPGLDAAKETDFGVEVGS